MSTRKGLKAVRDQQIAYARECMANYEDSGESEPIYKDIARIHVETARKLNRVQWKLKHEKAESDKPGQG